MYTPPTPTRRDSTVSSRRRRRCVLGLTWDFRLSLDFFDSGLYTCTAVARLTLALAKLSCEYRVRLNNKPTPEMCSYERILLQQILYPVSHTLSCYVVLLPKLFYVYTRNTLDCDQSNYSSRIVFPTYLLNLVKVELAPFDPPTPKTLSSNQTRSKSDDLPRRYRHLKCSQM